jgi:hypothetical protein
MCFVRSLKLLDFVPNLYVSNKIFKVPLVIFQIILRKPFFTMVYNGM